MGILDHIERGLERAVNGAFARTFRSGLQPIELASALKNELDTKTQIISRDRILVPNVLTVQLSAQDHERLAGIGSSLRDELVHTLMRHAEAQGYTFPGALSLSLVPSDSVGLGQLRISSRVQQGRIVMEGVIDIEGHRRVLRRGRTVVGRASTADVVIPDSGTSKHHAAIDWDGTRATVTDLQSTNGTKVDGRRVESVPLESGSVVTFGRVQGTFRALPLAEEQARS